MSLFHNPKYTPEEYDFEYLEKILEQRERIVPFIFTKSIELSAPVAITVLAASFEMGIWLTLVLILIGGAFIFNLVLTAIRRYHLRSFRRAFFVKSIRMRDLYQNYFYRESASRNLIQHKFDKVSEAVNTKMNFKGKLNIAFDYKDRISYVLSQLVNYYQRDSNDSINFRVSLMIVDGDELKIAKNVYPQGLDCQTKRDISNKKIKLTKGKGCCGKAWEEGVIKIVGDVKKDLENPVNERIFEVFNKKQLYNIRSIYSVPIFDSVKDNSEVIGVVNVDCNKAGRFKEEVYLHGNIEVEDEVNIFIKFLNISYALDKLKKLLR